MSKSWNEKMSDLYSDRDRNSVLKRINRMFPKTLDRLGVKQVKEDAKLKVWFGTMDDKAKEKRALPYKDIEMKLETLLEKGYRMVKSSAITPKGVYSLTGVPEKKEEPNAANLFFELKPNYEEFVDIYDRFGRYENNFPDYFKTKGDFDKYVENSDIFIIEDIQTNKPVGFITYNLVDAGTPEAQEYKEDCNLDIKNKLIYNDTVALYSELHGKGVGRLVHDVIDGYYLQVFGKDCEYGLYTGEINTTDKGGLAKDFHEKRGFVNWVETEAPFSKWKNRYKSMADKARKFSGDYKKHIPLPSYNSYRGL